MRRVKKNGDNFRLSALVITANKKILMGIAKLNKDSEPASDEGNYRPSSDIWDDQDLMLQQKDKGTWQEEEF